MTRERLTKIKTKLKTGIAVGVAVVAMSATVFAGTSTLCVNESFTVPAGTGGWKSNFYEFPKSSHTMKVSFQKTYKSGDAHVGFYRKGTFYEYCVASKDVAITTVTTGVQKTVYFSSVSKGSRRYLFGSDGYCSYSISSFNDTWNN